MILRFVFAVVQHRLGPLREAQNDDVSAVNTFIVISRYDAALQRVVIAIAFRWCDVCFVSMRLLSDSR